MLRACSALKSPGALAIGIASVYRVLADAKKAAGNGKVAA